MPSGRFDLVSQRQSRQRQDSLKRRLKEATRASDSPFVQTLFSRVVAAPFTITQPEVAEAAAAAAGGPSTSADVDGTVGTASPSTGLRNTGALSQRQRRELHCREIAKAAAANDGGPFWFSPAPMLRAPGRPDSAASANLVQDGGRASPPQGVPRMIDFRDRKHTLLTEYREKLLDFTRRPQSAVSDASVPETTDWGPQLVPDAASSSLALVTSDDGLDLSDNCGLPADVLLHPTGPAVPTGRALVRASSAQPHSRVASRGSRPPLPGIGSGSRPASQQSHTRPRLGSAGLPPRPSSSSGVNPGSVTSASPRRDERGMACASGAEPYIRPGSAMTVYSMDGDKRQGDANVVSNDHEFASPNDHHDEGAEAGGSPRMSDTEIRAIATPTRTVSYYCAKARGQKLRKPRTSTNDDRVDAVFHAPAIANAAEHSNARVVRSASQARHLLEQHQHKSTPPTATTTTARECAAVLRIKLLRRSVAGDASPAAKASAPAAAPKLETSDAARSRRGVVRARYNHL